MGVALAGRRRWIWLAVAVVVLALIAVGVVRALTAGATDEQATAAETATVDKGVVTTEVATTGTLQPAQTRSLAFAVDGTVESVKVRAGTTVEAGDVLAAVDDADAAEAVEDAETALADARDALDEAEESASAASSPAPTTACAGANVAAAYTSPAAVPPSVTASASSSALPSSAAPSPSRSRSAAATVPPVTTAPRATRSTPAPAATQGGGRGTSTCATSGSGGAQQGGGSGSGGDAVLTAQKRVNQAEVTLAEAQEALDGATITAPIAGRILTVGGKVGSQVGSGSAFITLADVYDMQISADFPEADADHLAVTHKAVITLVDKARQTFAATVVLVDPVGTSDGTLTRFGVVLSFDDAPDELLVGQSASVRVTTGSAKDVLRVPSTAVHDVSGDSGTLLQGGARTPVRLGLRGDQYTEISSGLAEGDVVTRSW